MLPQQCSASSQYLRKEPINVTILNIVNPGHFVVKEADGTTTSVEFKNFVEAEQSMQQYYESIEPYFFQIPVKNTLVTVLFQDKFCRARVISILSLSSGYLFKVYLLDYGKECSVPRECLYEMHEDFTSHPFQAVDFKLLGLEPISLTMNPDLSMSYGPVSEWDPSAEKFVNDLIKSVSCIHIETLGFNNQSLYGKLLMTFDDGNPKSLNELLIQNKYAQFNENLSQVSTLKDPGKSNEIEEQTIKTQQVLESTSFESMFKIKYNAIPDANSSSVAKQVSVKSSTFNKELVSSSQEQNHNVDPDQNLKQSPREIVRDYQEQTVTPIKPISRLERLQKLEQLKKSRSTFSQSVSTSSNDFVTKVTASNETPSSNIRQSNPLDSTNVSEQTFQVKRDLINDLENSPGDNTQNEIQSSKETSPQKPPNKTPPINSLEKLRRLQKSKTKSNALDRNDEVMKKESHLEPNIVNLSRTNVYSDSADSEISKQDNLSPPPTTDKLTNFQGDCDSSVKTSKNLKQFQKFKEKMLKTLQSNVMSTSPSEEKQSESCSNSSTGVVVNNDSHSSQLQDRATKLSDLEKMKKFLVSKRNMSGKMHFSGGISSPESNTDLQNCSLQSNFKNNNNDVSLVLSPRCVSSASPVSNTNEKIGFDSGCDVSGNESDSKSANIPSTSLLKAKSVHIFNTQIKVQNESENESALKAEKLTKFDNLHQTCDLPNSHQIQGEDSVKKTQVDTSVHETNLFESTVKEYKSDILKSIDQVPPGKFTDEVISPCKSNDSAVCLITAENDLEVFEKDSPKRAEVSKPLHNSPSKDNTTLVFAESVNTSEPEDMGSFMPSALASSVNFNDESLWKKQKVPALQLGKCIPEPILNTEQAQFPHHLNRILKGLKFHGPSSIQSVVWPSMNRRRSLIAVAPPHSGKTVAYVLPIVSQFITQSSSSPGDGPICIILCSSWKKVEAVYNLFKIFLRDLKVKIVTLTANGVDIQQKIVELVNGCDILIAVPSCLLQFFEMESINFSRCASFILDDGTTLITDRKLELKNVLLQFMNGVKQLGKVPQIVICAERWNKNFQLILDKIMPSPLLFFTSFLEAAIFSKISITAHVCENDNKVKKLLDILQDPYRVIVCTSNIASALDIHQKLRFEGIKSYHINEEMEHFIIEDVVRDWKSIQSLSGAHCLIVTDGIMINLYVSNADCLIHYDIPQDSRLQFGNRFSCIAEHFEKNYDQSCVCHMLVTESDSDHAAHLIDIMENCGNKPSIELKNLKGKKNEIITDATTPLCLYLKAYGFCKISCKQRHFIIPDIDRPQAVPNEGDVLGIVTHVDNASHFYIRLLRYLKPEDGSNQIKYLAATYAEMGFLLKDHFRSTPVDEAVKDPEIGKQYVLSDDGLFFRVKVLDKIDPTSPFDAVKWKLFFLDEGWIKSYDEMVLFEISDKVELPPPLAVEVYLCKIMPADSCPEWNPHATHFISDIIKGREIQGKIVLCLGETLWLHPVVIREKLSTINTHANLVKIDQALKDSSYAIENRKHIDLLYKLSIDKIPLPKIIKPDVKQPDETETEEKSSPVTYAFLELNTYEDVYVSSVKSPHQFYVQRAKFVDCLDKLVDEINLMVENKECDKGITLYKGMHCIAPFHEDDKYYRAVITDIQNDSDVVLFYVDFGDTGVSPRKDVYVLPPKCFMLPFQAIECELDGICAPHGGWTESVADALSNLTRNDDGDMKIVSLKAYKKTLSYDGGNHYVIDLWAGNKSIADQLLQEGLAVSRVSTDVLEEEVVLPNQDYNCADLSSDEYADKEAASFVAGVLAKLVFDDEPVKANQSADGTDLDESLIFKKNGNFNLQQQLNIPTKPFPKPRDSINQIKPSVTWWDTVEQLHVFINLKDIKVYDFHLTDDGFTFKTVIKGIEYHLDEKFYEKIESANASMNSSPQGVGFKVKKQVGFKWPRLNLDKLKFFHIKYDMNHLEDSDSGEEKIVNNNTRQPLTKYNYDQAEESDNTTTDYEETHCQSWRDIVKNRDPHNPFE